MTMTGPGQAIVHGKAFTLQPPKGSSDRPFLVVEVSITCEVCGRLNVMIAGHHLRPLVALLQQLIDEADPALTGAGAVECIKREHH